MKNKYPHIFEPMTIRRMTVKNRIVMTPMGTNYGEQNGEMSFLHINYYEQRAKGGTGLLIVENASVDSPQGSNGTTQLRIDLDNYIPRLFKLCENVHKHGACIAIQLNHAGASARSSSRIPVSSVIRSSNFRPGSTNVENSSAICPCSTRIAPISMIRSLLGFRPVVSKSILT